MSKTSLVITFNFSPIGKFGWCYVNNRNHWGFCSRSCIMSQTSGNELVCEISRMLFITYKSSFDELFPRCCNELVLLKFLSKFEAFFLKEKKQKYWFSHHLSICPTLDEMKQACDSVNPPLGLFCRNTSLFKWWIQTNVEMLSSQR